MKTIRVQRFGALMIPTRNGHRNCSNCRDIAKLPDGSYRLKLTNCSIQTIPAGDFDIEEVLHDGTTRRIP